MGVIFSAVGFVVGLGPGTAGKTLFGKQMYGVAQVLITSPALMALPMLAGAFGHWCSAGEALEVLGITFEAFPIIADLS